MMCSPKYRNITEDLNISRLMYLFLEICRKCYIMFFLHHNNGHKMPTITKILIIMRLPKKAINTIIVEVMTPRVINWRNFIKLG